MPDALPACPWCGARVVRPGERNLCACGHRSDVGRLDCDCDDCLCADVQALARADSTRQDVEDICRDIEGREPKE